MLAALILVSIAGIAVGNSGNYDMDFFCNNQDKLCDGDTHVACELDQFSASCGDERQIVGMTRERITMILDEHNKGRSKIALGKLSNFGTAARMMTLEWDYDLAALAQLNVKKCKKHHSACRNTPEYERVGQNIAINECSGYGSDFKDNDEIIKFFIEDWYSEYKECDESAIKSTPEGGPIVYHFLTMVCDRQTHVGCAMSRYIDSSGNKKQYFVCNYATTSVFGYPVYVEGSSASHCKSGENPNYSGLCSVDEKIDENDFHIHTDSEEWFKKQPKRCKGRKRQASQENRD